MIRNKDFSNWVLRYVILVITIILAWVFPNLILLRVIVIFYPVLNVGLYGLSKIGSQMSSFKGKTYFNTYRQVIFGLACVSSGFMSFTYLLPRFPYRFLTGSTARAVQVIFFISLIGLFILSYRFKGSNKPLFKDGSLKKIIQSLLCLLVYGSGLLFTVNLMLDNSKAVVNELTVLEVGSRQFRSGRRTRTQHYFMIECPQCGCVRRDVSNAVYRYYTESVDNQVFIVDWEGFLGWSYFEIVTETEAFERGLIQEY